MSLNEEEKENINPYGADSSGRRKRLTSGESMLPRIEDFSILKPISRGAFGKVFLGCKKTAPNKKYAIKVMKKEEMINKNMVNQVKAERDALALSKSPFVVHLYYSLQSKQNIYLVMEYMIGGDVKSLLAMYGYFDEEMAVVYIAEVTLALEYLHCHGIIHRDLKPDNMLISSEGHIKLTDFGLSKTTLDRDLHVRDIVNSPYIPRASNADYFRTPGQVLSLTSHLAFSLSSKKKVGNHSLLSSAGSFSSCASPLLAKGRKQLDLASPDSVQCTPPPVLSLTPTLRASLDWRHSSASEHSSIVGQIRRASRVSGLSAGSRRLSTVDTDESTFFHNDSDIVDCNASMSDLPLESKVLRERKGSASNEAFKFAKQSARRRASEQAMTLGQILEASSPAAVMRRLSQPSVSTAGQSDQDKDKDTPHLFRSREMIQKSYAALHLKNMREGSFEDSDGSESSLPLESDDELSLNKPSDPNTTVESIEMQRHQQESSSSPGVLNLTNVTKLCFSPESSSDSEPVTGGKKRPFRFVDKSPIFSGNSGHSSGLTMEISAVSLGDEHRLKRKSLSHLEVPQFLSSPASRASENTESAVLSSSCYSDSCSSSQKSASPVARRSWPRDDCTGSPPRDCSYESSESDDEENKGNVTVLSTCSSNCNDNDNDCSDGEKLMEAHPDCPESDGKELDRYITRMEATQSRRRTISNSSESSKGQSLRSSCPELDMSVHNLSLEEQSGDGGEESNRSPSVERLRHDSRSGTDNESSASKTKRGRRRSSSLQDLLKAQKELEETETAKGTIEKPRTKFAGVKKVTRFMSLPSSMSSGTSGIQTPKMSKLCHRTPMVTPGRVPQTPFRTPKSVRRGPAHTETERILGTPDYLAPELLLRKEHGVAVDWWALGVCLYEFLTGIPPFNDQTPESVFQNILTRDIPWPEDEEALSGDAHQAIESLLSFDPESRPTAAVLKEHPLFKTLDWENLHQLTPPFVPNPDDDSDTSYFDARNTLHHLQVSGIDF